MKNKRPKRDMAKKMLSEDEIENHVGVFDSKAWNGRATALRAREATKREKWNTVKSKI